MSNYLTMAQLRDKTIARVWADQKTAKLSAYLSGKVVEGFGKSTRVSSITARMIDDYIETMEQRGNSNGTINRKLAVLSPTRRSYAPPPLTPHGCAQWLDAQR